MLFAFLRLSSNSESGVFSILLFSVSKTKQKIGSVRKTLNSIRCWQINYSRHNRYSTWNNTPGHIFEKPLILITIIVLSTLGENELKNVFICNQIYALESCRCVDGKGLSVKSNRCAVTFAFFVVVILLLSIKFGLHLRVRRRKGGSYLFCIVRDENFKNQQTTHFMDNNKIINNPTCWREWLLMGATVYNKSATF